MRTVVGIVLAVLAGSPALAQQVAQVDEDAMEVQRCIWRCQANYPVWSEYEACVAQQCSGSEQQAAPEPPPEPPPALSPPSPLAPQQSLRPGSKAPSASAGLPKVPAGAWRYGDHPVFGPSAYVEVGDGTVSLACAYSGTDPTVGDILRLRLTGNILAPGQVTVMFQGRPDAFTIEDETGSGQTEKRGNTCETAVSAFRGADALVLVPGRIDGIQSVGGGTEITIDNGGRRSVIRSAKEGARLPGSRLIPLKGSSAAIGKLIAACPAARLDIENNCGI